LGSTSAQRKLRKRFGSRPEVTRQTLKPTRPSDGLVTALARYVEALDRRYPGGPAQLGSELDGRGKVSVMPTIQKPRPAA
jgi:hypothetical protein